MKIFFVNFTNQEIKETFFKEILKKIEVSENLESNICLNLVLLGEKGIRGINKRYRGKNQVTDVLSFSFSEIKKPTKKELLFVEPQNEDNLLGEILLCPSRIKKQAKRKKKDFKEELAFVFIHGFLHLLGYNHTNTQNTKEMRSKEKDIIKKITINKK